MLATAAAVLGQVRKAKTAAKLSIRAEAARVVVRGPDEAAVRASESDLRAAGNIADFSFEHAPELGDGGHPRGVGRVLTGARCAAVAAAAEPGQPGQRAGGEPRHRAARLGPRHRAGHRAEAEHRALADQLVAEPAAPAVRPVLVGDHHDLVDVPRHGAEHAARVPERRPAPAPARTARLTASVSAVA